MMETKYIQLCSRLNLAGNIKNEYSLLVKQYSEPGRFYHNINHIKMCLDEFENVSHLSDHPDIIEFAIWYHDIIYDVSGSDNEEQSARVAIDIFQNNSIKPAMINSLRELILATKHNAAPDSIDQKIIIDIDLSILGQDKHIFNEYDRAIRKEYSHVPVEVYNDARCKILKTFLDRTTIYSLPYFIDKYEIQARNNLKNAIISLTES